MKPKFVFRPLELFVAVCGLALVIKAFLMYREMPHSRSFYVTELVGSMWIALCMIIQGVKLSGLPGLKLCTNVIIMLALVIFSFASWAIIFI